MRTYLKNIPIGQLKDHPLNKQVFGKEQVDDLSESIGRVGIEQPLTVAQVGDVFRVVSGHRRKAAAIRLKMEDVPCYVRTDLADPPQAGRRMGRG